MKIEEKCISKTLFKYIFRSVDEYREHRKTNVDVINRYEQVERYFVPWFLRYKAYPPNQSSISGRLIKRLYDLLIKLLPQKYQEFYIQGFSYPAKKEVQFLVDFKYSSNNQINWRERVVCPITGLNNRIRATVHIFETDVIPSANDCIYITEQVTPLFKYLSAKYPDVIGSEFLGNNIAGGFISENGIRHEDLTNLSFSNEQFSCVVSLDCLEHIPNYIDAFAECFRVLKPGGKFIWSVPFLSNSEKNLIRAKLNKDGSIEYFLPPEYHGDPVGSGGILCFTHFGWNMIDEVKHVGFSDTYAIFFWSSYYGYLGGEQVLFIAIK
ncbi:MAG TPA: class I SAM-dependent methyltransferase [Anaerolineaceae bacterium]